MDIRAYLKKYNLTQEQFGKLAGVSQGAVWQWLNGRSQVAPETAVAIEKATGGKIKRHELRPDLYSRAA